MNQSSTKTARLRTQQDQLTTAQPTAACRLGRAMSDYRRGCTPGAAPLACAAAAARARRARARARAPAPPHAACCVLCVSAAVSRDRT